MSLLLPPADGAFSAYKNAHTDVKAGDGGGGGSIGAVRTVSIQLKRLSNLPIRSCVCSHQLEVRLLLIPQPEAQASTSKLFSTP